MARGRRDGPARAADPRPLAAPVRRPGRGRGDGGGVGAVAGAPPASATRRARPAPARATCCGRCSTRGSATSRSGSAAARPPTAGAGLLRSLGAEVSDDLSAVDLDHLDGRLAETRLRIACDVTNPLLGPTGAAAIYGPQKGASPADVLALDMRCARFADALERAAGRRERDTPGAGAAGGVGFAMLALAGQFAELELRPGRRPRDGGGRLRPRPGGVPARDHRRGADRRPDRVRQDRARRGEAGAGGGPAVHRGRRRRDPGRHRRAGRRRRDRDAAGRGAARARGRDRRGDRPGRAVRRADRPAVRRGADAAGGDAAPRHEPASRRLVHRRLRRRKPASEEAGEEARPPQGRSGQGLGELPPALPAGAGRLRPRAADGRLRRAGLGVAPRPDERADPDDPDPEHGRRERREGLRGAARSPTRASATPRSTSPASAGAATACPRRRRPTGRRSSSPRCPSSSTSSGPAGWGRRRRRGSRRRCATSASSAATTRSSSWATCRRSRPATG